MGKLRYSKCIVYVLLLMVCVILCQCSNNNQSKGNNRSDYVQRAREQDSLRIAHYQDSVEKARLATIAQKEKEEAERVKAEQEHKKQEEAKKAEETRIITEKKKQDSIIIEKERIENLRLAGKGYNGIYQIGDYYNNDGKEGIVFQISDDGHHGKIVSLSHPEKSWGNPNLLINKNRRTENDKARCLDGENGKNNMLHIQQISGWRSKYPAFAWCEMLGDEWYLPAIEELYKILSNKLVVQGLENKGWKEYYTHYYSSTQDDENPGVVYKIEFTLREMKVETDLAGKFYDHFNVCAVALF